MFKCVDRTFQLFDYGNTNDFFSWYKLVSSKTGHESGERCKLPWAPKLVSLFNLMLSLQANFLPLHDNLIYIRRSFLLIVFFGEILTSNSVPFGNKYLSFDRLIICIIIRCIGTAALGLYSVLIIATYLVGWKYEHWYD